jgi:hypothetical protein
MTTTLEPPAAEVEVQLQEIASAMVTAAEAARDMPETREPSAAARGFAARFVYSSCYYASFSVVLPTLFVARAVPGFGPVASGLCDGAKAAADSIAARGR